MKYVLGLVFVFFCFSMEAQMSFHRLYKVENQQNSVGIAGGEGNVGPSYFTLTGLRNANDSITSLVIDFLETKGGVNNSFLLSFGIQAALISELPSGMIQTRGDTTIVTVSLEGGGEATKVVLAFRPSVDLNTPRELIWARTFTPDENAAGQLRGSHLLARDRSFRTRQVQDYAIEDTTYILRNIISSTGIGISAAGIQLFEKDTTTLVRPSVMSYQISRDSSEVFSSFLVDSGESAIIVLDSLSNVNWARKIRLADTTSNVQLQIRGAVQSLDKNFYFGGRFTPANEGVLADSLATSFVGRMDTFGNLLWARQIFLDTLGTFNEITGVTTVDDELIVAGVYMDTTAARLHSFMASLDSLGQVIWITKYDKVPAQLGRAGSFIETTDGGFAYFHTGLTNEGTQAQNFIKTNRTGSSSCEGSLPSEIFLPLELVSDTLVAIFHAFDTIYSRVVTVTSEDYNKYDIPVLSLATRPFCPKEVIDWTFDANVPGAVKWEWNTGATSDTLRVFEEGTYQVTVTIDEDACFTLCDTATIARIDPPGVNIRLEFGSFCETGRVTLVADYIPGADPTSFVWSTGETGPRIEVSDLGVYAVTVTDSCDETATNTFSYAQQPVTIAGDELILSTGLGDFCQTGLRRVTLNTDALRFPVQSISWSTGATNTNTIEIPTTGTYTVTVTNVCGQSATNAIVVNDFPQRITAINIQNNADFFCRQAVGEIRVTATSQMFGIAWNTGETTNVITPKIGVSDYRVTVTDVCGTTFTATTTVSQRPGVIEAESVQIVPEFVCDEVILRAVVEGEFRSILWIEGGQTTETIRVKSSDITGPTTFQVRIISDCEPLTASFTVSPENFKLLLFPKILLDVAQLTNEQNNKFGAVNRDSIEVTSFELAIFNRWGREVYRTTSIEENWDGRYPSREPAPLDVYVWFCKYTTEDGCTHDVKGDLTLFR